MPIKVIVVDDSALMREMLTGILSRDNDIVVVDTASDPLIAREKIKQHNPDVITLDVEMPRMNGIEFLTKIMSLRPMPVVMFSSLTQEGTDTSLKALEIGAVDVVGKPTGFVTGGMEAMAEDLIAKVKGAARSRVKASVHTKHYHPLAVDASSTYQDKIIALGASTGGIPALSTILESLPDNAPPVVITQHMPPGFTERFAQRVNEKCEIKVQEGRHGQKLERGNAYIAPGGYQMRVKRTGGEYKLDIITDDKVNGFCPSVDVLFDSLAIADGPNTVAAILTGMGDDGAEGLLRLRKAGAITYGQDEATCVVYGMPRAAFEMGGVVKQLPISKIAHAILEQCKLPLKRTA